MNPPGMFLDGKRQREYSATNDPLALSGRLIPEFFGRRNIRDMFARKTSLPRSQSSGVFGKDTEASGALAANQGDSSAELLSPVNGIAEDPRDSTVTVPTSSPLAVGKKRSAPSTTGNKSTKRGKSASVTATLPMTGKGQQSLKGFFKPSDTLHASIVRAIQGGEVSKTSLNDDAVGRASKSATDFVELRTARDDHTETASPHSALQTSREKASQCVQAESSSAEASPIRNHRVVIEAQENVHDPVESKESWSKLFAKPATPRCEGHDEPCISLLTKKSGMNLGRSFWMCSRPLGPSGAKEKNTQWRCQTFIWCSDWNPIATSG